MNPSADRCESEPPSPPAPPPSQSTKLAEPAAATASASRGASGRSPSHPHAQPDKRHSDAAAQAATSDAGAASRAGRSASAGASSATRANSHGSATTHSSSVESARTHSRTSSGAPLPHQKTGLRLADCAGGLVGGGGAVWPGGSGENHDAVKRRRSLINSQDSQGNGNADVDGAPLLHLF